MPRKKKPEIRPEWERLLVHNPTLESEARREIEYRNIKPEPITVQIPLWEYFERMKRFRVDRWQRDLCDRLQKAAETRHKGRWWAVIHAEGQLGKTSIISQAFPAWLFGHDPLFRYALAMYNISRSENHSSVVINDMSTSVYKDIFPNKDGWIWKASETSKTATAKSGWMTNARMELNDGQLSFNPVGLRSGLTGSGYDWLSIDDPYKEAQEAFSGPINEQMRNFYEYTVLSRTGEHSSISGMFHRYAPEDFAGFLLDTGDFDYIRYATQADGDYIHPSTGKRYPDPLGRAPGEYISPERRRPQYYDKARKNNRVWLSMFQGRPSSEEGDFFNVGKMNPISPEKGIERLSESVAACRAWDMAATDEAGAYSVAGKMSILPSGRCTIHTIWRKRVDTAVRVKKQVELARGDGHDVTIVIPIDPGAAGKSVVYYTEADLASFTVAARPTSGSKVQRALNFSVAVNSGMVDYVEEVIAEDEEPWIPEMKKELRDFPLSDYKDIVDALSDGYNHLWEISRRGTVVKNYVPQRHLVSIDQFNAKFPGIQLNRSELNVSFELPKKWAIYAGIKLSQEGSRATSAVIVARATQHSDLPEDLFVLDEYKAYDANMYALFDWIKERMAAFGPDRDITIWLHPDSEQYKQTIASKLDFRVSQFTDDNLAGHNELNWYLLPTEKSHPFGNLENASHIYFITDPKYLSTPEPDKPHSFYHARQEMATWGFDDQGDPTQVGDVVDCLRMITHRFKTYAERFTMEEEFDLEVRNRMGNVDTLTPEAQIRLSWAKHNAARAMEEKYGPEALDDELYEADIEFEWQ